MTSLYSSSLSGIVTYKCSESSRVWFREDSAFWLISDLFWRILPVDLQIYYVKSFQLFSNVFDNFVWNNDAAQLCMSLFIDQKLNIEILDFSTALAKRKRNALESRADLQSPLTGCLCLWRDSLMVSLEAPMLKPCQTNKWGLFAWSFNHFVGGTAFQSCLTWLVWK